MNKVYEVEQDLTPSERRYISRTVFTRSVKELVQTAHHCGELTPEDIGTVLETFARRIRRAAPVSNSGADDGADAS